jgi:hypothetical protein
VATSKEEVIQEENQQIMLGFLMDAAMNYDAKELFRKFYLTVKHVKHVWKERRDCRKIFK